MSGAADLHEGGSDQRRSWIGVSLATRRERYGHNISKMTQELEEPGGRRDKGERRRKRGGGRERAKSRLVCCRSAVRRMNECSHRQHRAASSVARGRLFRRREWNDTSSTFEVKARIRPQDILSANPIEKHVTHTRAG